MRWVTRKGKVLAGHMVVSCPSAYLHCIWWNGHLASEGDGNKYRMEYFLKEQTKTHTKKEHH